MSGPRAAQLFYDPRYFQRQGAAPEALKATLFGKGGVQGLDGEQHRLRKAMFMTVTAPEQLADLEAKVRDAWERALPAWAAAGTVPLYRAVQPVLTRAVCDWAGVALPEADLMLRSRQLTALFDSAASGVVRHFRARLARWQTERWLAAVVEQFRAGEVALPADSVARRIAEHREAGGKLLPARVAAVELLNVLRPTVAVSVYIAFLAHALHTQEPWRRLLAERLAQGETADALAFVQEVRRHYPFFPAVVASVRETFDWNGMRFPKGRRVLLDLYGTNHDTRTWSDPYAFRPERWLHQRPGHYEFIPQGGGEAAIHHRCPGEDVTLRLMVLAARMLLLRMQYEVPAQDLCIAMSRLPAIPAEGFILRRVRAA